MLINFANIIKCRDLKSNRNFRLFNLSAIIIAIVGLQYSTIYKIYELCLSNRDFNGLILAPLFCLIVLFKRRKFLISFQWKTIWCTFFPLICLIVLQFLKYPQNLRIQMLLLITSIGFSFLTILGWPSFKYITAPLLLALFSMPLPSKLWQDAVIIMQYLSLKVSAILYNLILPISFEGYEIFLHTSQKWTVVSSECSGIRSLLGLCMTGWFIILVSNIKPTIKLAIASLVPFIAFSLNICRIILTLLLRDCGMEEISRGMWHGLAGVLFFLIGLFTVKFIIKLSEVNVRYTSFQ